MMEDKIPAEHDITEADQVRGLDAIRATEHLVAPPRLHAAVAEMLPARTVPVWRRPRPLALAGSLVAAAAVVLVLVLSGGGTTATPTVPDVSRLALAPARDAAPAHVPGTQVLDEEIGGVSYPYWSDSSGWTATGARDDVLEGRQVRTVVYRDAEQRTIGYSIADGSTLPRTGRFVRHGSVKLWVLRVDGADVVTWERKGRTCVLASRDVGSDVMVRLAAGTVA
jgi:hypothetical protein